MNYGRMLHPDLKKVKTKFRKISPHQTISDEIQPKSGVLEPRKFDFRIAKRRSSWTVADQSSKVELT